MAPLNFNIRIKIHPNAQIKGLYTNRVYTASEELDNALEVMAVLEEGRWLFSQHRSMYAVSPDDFEILDQELTTPAAADETPSSSRLEILERSLAKKEAELERRFEAMFADRKSANGQPLNDKRNGAATFRRWENQDDGIRNMKAEIEKTKNAIEKEKGLIIGANRAKTGLPSPISTALENGDITQWRKYPNTFFVKGVDKARIVWDEKKQELSYKYLGSITDPDQRKIFAKTFNEMKKAILEESPENWPLAPREPATTVKGRSID